MTRVLAAALVFLAACQDGDAIRVAWRWSAPAPAYVGTPATASNGDVAATYGHAALVVVAADGRPRWEATLVGLRDVAPVITATAVVAATDDGVAGFDRRTGHLRWRRALDDRASTPAVSGATVVVTTWDGRLVAIDRWSIDLPAPSLGPPALSGDVVVAAWDSGVLAARVNDGAVLWAHDFGAVGTSAPAIGRGMAVVVGGDRRVHAFDLKSGRERWSRPTPGAGAPEAPPAVAGDTVAAVDRLGYVAVVNLDTGRLRWRGEAGGAVERGGPVFVRDAVIVPVDDGRLIVMSRDRRRTIDPPGRISGVTAARNTAVYATREAGTNGLTALAI